MAAAVPYVIMAAQTYFTAKQVLDKPNAVAGPALPEAPKPVDATAAAAKNVRRKAKPTARETLLTGPAGVATPAPSTRKTLLGL